MRGLPSLFPKSEMSIEVHPLAAEDHLRWDQFTTRHAHASPFHLIAWKQAIEGIFGYQPRYQVALEAGQVRGVLPLFLVETLLTGRILLSTPFAVYGGILADSEAAREALRQRALGLSRELGVEYLELRNAWPEQCLGFDRIDRYVTFTQEVGPADADKLLEALPKKARNMVRKALKYGYSTRRAGSRLGEFYRLLAASYRRLGTPVFPPRFFAAILEHFGDLVDVREVVLQDKVVAASLNFFFRGEMHTYYAASDPAYLAMAPNNYMYFDHLLWAGANGFQRFDFGRSKLDTGTFEFKRHWGASMRPLPYEVHLVKRKDLPNFSPKNPKFELAIRLWRKLPLAVTKLLGPPLVRWFP